MKLSAIICAILLLTLSHTLSSCFITKKQKHVTKSDKDSIAYTETESTRLLQRYEAWWKYLRSVDTNVSGITFNNTPCPDTTNKVILHIDGSIEARGNIKDVWNKHHKETVKSDSGIRQTIYLDRYINKTYTEVKTVTITRTVTVTKRPNYKLIVIIALLIALSLWAYTKRKKVISLIAGYVTGM